MQQFELRQTVALVGDPIGADCLKCFFFNVRRYLSLYPTKNN